jgi:c-di-GMP-binding flagellar brake protein YcgR
LTLRSLFAEESTTDMSTTDLSLGGAQVVTSRFLPLMTRVEIVLHLPPEDSADPRPRAVRAEAVVVRVSPPQPRGGSGSYEMALFFSRMEQQDRSALARYLSAQSAGR